MGHHSRICRIAKWTGVVVCLVLLVACVASLRWVMAYEFGVSHWSTMVCVEQGHFLIYWSDSPVERDLGFYYSSDQHAWEFLVPYQTPSKTPGIMALDPYITIPAWIPFALLAIPTAYLLWRDGRPPRWIRPSRIRRIAKWTGLVVCVVVVVGWVTSSRVHGPWRVGEYTLGVGDGAVIVSSVASTGTLSHDATGMFSLIPPVSRHTVIPIWMILTAAMIPTAYLFWRDRCYPRGHCQKCGYDWQGTVGDVCPECGLTRWAVSAIHWVLNVNPKRRRTTGESVAAWTLFVGLGLLIVPFLIMFGGMSVGIYPDGLWVPLGCFIYSMIIGAPVAFVGLVGLIVCYVSHLRRPPPVGHCPKCGYNLTGNVSGRCPECGKEVEAMHSS